MVKEGVVVPEVLRIGTRGVRVKLWTFLYLNEPRSFTAQEIADHLKMPLSTVQVAIKNLRMFAPRIRCVDKERSGKGRRVKEYSFQKILQ